MNSEHPGVIQDLRLSGADHIGHIFEARVVPLDRGMTVFLNDVTERKRAEEELFRREREFQLLVENSPDIISRLDKNLCYVYVNPAVERASGIAPDAYLGKTQAEVGLPESLVQLLNEKCLSAFITGLEQTLEFGLDSKHKAASLVEWMQQNEITSSTPVIMLTSSGQRGESTRCRELGVAAYLTKPILQADLRDTILSVIVTHSLKKNESSDNTSPVGLQATNETASHPKPSKPSADLHLRVLLAEDNIVNQKLAVRLLEKRGHTVVVAGNGREALAAMETEKFDLILMDVQMPEMNGLEATSAIRQMEKTRGGHIPIVAMTANAMKGDKEICLQAGMDGYVSKPIQPNQLFEVIGEMVASTGKAIEDATEEVLGERAALNPSAALARLDGDTELLVEISELFLKDCPVLLSEIKESLDLRDGQALIVQRINSRVRSVISVPSRSMRRR